MTTETAQVATAAISLVGTMFSGIMAYMMAKLKKEQAASHAEVKKKLEANEERMTALAKVSASMHRMMTPGTEKSLVSQTKRPKATKKKTK